jgi:hypothetical protein
MRRFKKPRRTLQQQITRKRRRGKWWSKFKTAPWYQEWKDKYHVITCNHRIYKDRLFDFDALNSIPGVEVRMSFDNDGRAWEVEAVFNMVTKEGRRSAWRFAELLPDSKAWIRRAANSADTYMKFKKLKPR